MILTSSTSATPKPSSASSKAATCSITGASPLTPERTVDEMGLLVRGLIRESGFSIDSCAPLSSARSCRRVTPDPRRNVRATPRRPCRRSSMRAHALPITLDVDEPLTVGADRIVNTLAAAQLYKRDTIAVDLGTATTFDCITADGVFIGGVIAPGVTTAAETLVRRTAKLPRVDLERPAPSSAAAPRPACAAASSSAPWTRSTASSTASSEEWQKPDALVVATGGLATLIGAALPDRRTRRALPDPVRPRPRVPPTRGARHRPPGHPGQAARRRRRADDA